MFCLRVGTFPFVSFHSKKITHTLFHKQQLHKQYQTEKSQKRFKSEKHSVYTQEINKIAQSSNDDKRLQTFDKITIYTCGTNALKYVKVK